MMEKFTPPHRISLSFTHDWVEDTVEYCLESESYSRLVRIAELTEERDDLLKENRLIKDEYDDMENELTVRRQFDSEEWDKSFCKAGYEFAKEHLDIDILEDQTTVLGDQWTECYITPSGFFCWFEETLKSLEEDNKELKSKLDAALAQKEATAKEVGQ